MTNYGVPDETTVGPLPPVGGGFDYDSEATAPLGSYGAGSAQNGVSAADDALPGAGGPGDYDYDYGGGAGGGDGGAAGGESGAGGAGGAGGSGDPNLAMLEKAVPGVPGEDYPIYAEVPETSFICDGQVDGGMKLNKTAF